LHILSEEGRKDIDNIQLPFRQKSVYHYWHQQVQDRWRYDVDPFQSACKYLAEIGTETCVKSLNNVVAQPGTRALGFQITDFVRELAPHAQEVALDSTCIIHFDMECNPF
jgi:hypothetical protein